MDDLQIINLFEERNEEAITQLQNKVERQIKALAIRIVGNEQDAEECVNDVYLAVWNSIPPQKPDSLVAFCISIARNLSLNKYRGNTALKRNNHYDLVLDELADCLSENYSVENHFLAKELGEYLNTFLLACKQIDRVIFVKRFYFCMEYGEIAKEVGLSENNVKVRMHRIRKRCKRYLEQQGFGETRISR